MYSQTFPKKARVLKRKQFSFITRSGVFCQGSQVVFYVLPSRYPTGCKLGITVSKKYGKAHKRNYFKRVVREVFRQVRANLPSCQVVVLPRNHKQQPIFSCLYQDFLKCIPESLDKGKRSKATIGDEYTPRNEKCVSGPL